MISPLIFSSLCWWICKNIFVLYSWETGHEPKNHVKHFNSYDRKKIRDKRLKFLAGAPHPTVRHVNKTLAHFFLSTFFIMDFKGNIINCRNLSFLVISTLTFCSLCWWICKKELCKPFGETGHEPTVHVKYRNFGRAPPPTVIHYIYVYIYIEQNSREFFPIFF